MTKKLSKIETVMQFAKICEVQTRKNLVRDLPKLEQGLVNLTVDLSNAIQKLPGMDPRRLTARKRYEMLCEGTALACKFFRAFLRNKPIDGVVVKDNDVVEALKAWVGELNRFANPNQRGLWPSMSGRQIKLEEKVKEPRMRFDAVEEFSLKVEDL